MLTFQTIYQYTQIRANMKGGWTWCNLWILLTINLKDQSFHNSVEWSGFYLQVKIPTWLGKFVLSALFKLLKNVFLKLPPWHDSIISPPMKNNPPFLENNPPYFKGEETLQNSLLLNPAKSYIKYYSSSSPRLIKNPSNYIRYISQNICNWLKRPETILEIRQKALFLEWSSSLLFTSFSLTLLTTERRLTWNYFFFCHRSLPNILKYWDHRWHLPTV